MKQQQAKIKLLGLENIIDIEMKCVPSVVWLELSGFHMDIDKFEEIKILIQNKYQESEKWLQNELLTYDKQQKLDGTFVSNGLNLSSPEQLKTALQKKGYDLDKTDKNSRAKYASDPIFEILADFKEANTLLKMFIKPLPDFIHSGTQRVYPNFWQYGAKQGRFSCGKPNLQQQPSRFKEWRSIFTAEQGNKLIVADYNQIELIILGQLAKDEKYIEAYRTAQDLHRRTAATMFNVPVDQVTKLQRNVAKSVNFGLNYGMGKTRLKGKLKLDTGQDFTEEEAAKFIQDFRELYPEVNTYLKKASREGLKKLKASTLTGRLFLFDPPQGDTEDEKQEQEGLIMRECKNFPISGLCADMLKIAMGNLFLILEPRGVKLVNCVHDELVFECKAEEAEEISQIVKAEMEKAGNLFLNDLPCVVDVTIANYWKKE
ncbi:MAG TPA: DNA polymerase [Bacteroidales bacterium]